MNVPYQELPPLPPSQDLNTPAIIRRMVAASRALAGVDAVARRLPNPNILIHNIPLLESQASSEIENIVITNDELFRAALNIDELTPTTREALNYRKALYMGLEHVKERGFSVNAAKLVCSAIRGSNIDIRHATGTYIGNPATKRRIYTPPEGKTVILEHLSKWESFAHDNSIGLDPLVKMALLHYQFEAIHPFSDGNGRTGRILNVLYLVDSGLLEMPITYLSGYIVQNKDEYYRLLNNVTQKGQWVEWIEYMLTAVEVTSLWTEKLIGEIYTQLDETITKLAQTKLPSRDLTYLLYRLPYLRYRDITESLNISRPTAIKWAGQLSQLGIVRQLKIGRNKVLVNHRYLDVLFNTSLPA